LEPRVPRYAPSGLAAWACPSTTARATRPRLRFELTADDRRRIAGLAPVGWPHPHREDHVEATVAEIQILEARDEEFGSPRPVEALAHHRGGDPVTAADLEDSIAGAKSELIDNGPQAHAHTLAWPG
jgi:hypothetical protein